MKLETASLLEFGLQPTLTILDRGFADYFVPIQITFEHILGMLRVDSVDATASRVVLKDSQPAGVALIARRGWSSRLAGMAILPEARGQGVGRWLVEQIIADAKARGDRRLELEVIEENTPAIHLYERAGFLKVRKLVSYSLENPSGTTVALSEIDMHTLGRLIILHGYQDFPWQISGESLLQMGLPNRAFRYMDSAVAISSPAAEQIFLRALLLNIENKTQIQTLLQGLFALFPDKTWKVPAIFPEEFSSTFEKSGFKREMLAQFQMALRLSAQP